MIRAYHAIVTTYGFWLPNDPRGSWSDYVRRWELLQHGEATKVPKQKWTFVVPFANETTDKDEIIIV